MASNRDEILFQCQECHGELNLDSKTLPCLHSFCRLCLDEHIKEGTNEANQCPECHESLTCDKLSLSPILAKSLRCIQLESASWMCDLCSEDGIESTATDWCYNCKKFYCAHCCRFHKKLQKEFNEKHHLIGLDGMEKEQVIKMVTLDQCHLHQETKSLFCVQCNVCLCKTCFDYHSSDSPGCSSQQLNVSEEATKLKSDSPTMAKEMDNLETTLKRLIERTRSFTDELDSDCNQKCEKLWQGFEDTMENAKRETDKMCEEIRQITKEQVESWRHLIEESEKILKQLEICRLNMRHLVSESLEDVDVFQGLQSLKSKLSSWIDKSVEPEESQLIVTFPEWWLQVLEHLKKDKIGTVSLSGQKLPDSMDLDKLPGVTKLDGLPNATNTDLELDKQWLVD